MNRVLITGGAGFIGSHLAERCLQRGDSVHIVIRPESSLDRIGGLEGDVHLHRFQLSDHGALQQCFKDVLPNHVYHLAARTRRPAQSDLSDAENSVAEDVAGLLAVIMAAAQTRPAPEILIRAGTLAEYGSIPAPYREDQREQPLSAYAAAMVAGTHYMQMLQPRLPFPAVTARLALIYGGGQSEDFLIPSLIIKCLSGETADVLHPGDRRDLLHIDDAIDALCRLGTCENLAGRIINIASGLAPTVYETASLILKSTGADASMIRFGQSDASGGTSELRASAELARNLLGWQARIPLSEGIETTVAWYREQQNGR